MKQGQNNLRLKNTSKLLLTMTLICGALSAAFFAAVNIVGGNAISASGPRLVLSTVVFSISLIAVFAALFAAALRPTNEGFWDARIQAAASAAFLASLDALSTVTQIDRGIFIVLASSIQAIFAFSFSRFMLSTLQLSGPWFALPPWIITMAMGVLGLGTFVLQTWIPLHRSIAYAGLAREILVSVATLAVLFACGWTKTLRIPQLSPINSLRFRLTREGQPTETALPFVVSVLATLAGLLGTIAGLTGILGPAGMTMISDPPQIMHLGGIAVIILSLREVARMASEQQHSAVTARLTAISAKRFFIPSLK